MAWTAPAPADDGRLWSLFRRYEEEPSTQKVATIGLDLAKNMLQVHGVEADGRVAVRHQLRRSEVHRFFSRLPPCLAGMEACATGHYWGRELSSYPVRVGAGFHRPALRRVLDYWNSGDCRSLRRPGLAGGRGTDMRRGMNGLELQVQESLGRCCGERRRKIGEDMTENPSLGGVLMVGLGFLLGRKS